jgi:cell pole-organizing protein PopZ
MTNPRDQHSLSRLELVVLARLSTLKPPTERALGDAVFELVLLAESAARAKEVALETLAALRGRGLVSERVRGLTDEGRRALRGAFGLSRVPTWTEVRDAHLPAFGLGLQPGSEQATGVVRSKDALAAAVLREHLEIREGANLNAVCDALIAEALGLPPGPVTMNVIRAHVLARRAGVPAKGSLKEIGASVAADAVNAKKADRRSMLQAIGRRWVNEADALSTSRPAQATQSTQPIQAVPPAQAVQPAQPAQSGPPATPEALLQVVRETIPRVGTDGRYGAEKVFVSAIWRSIERDHRLVDLSLDRFKRWLVNANRDGWLVLARADLVGAMDAKLVAESEIRDQGATFHFVLDRRTGASAADRGSHAR